jgi:dihydrofolate reductase
VKVYLVAVMSANGKIARSAHSSIDWNSSEDLKWFKEITTQIGTIIMGRKTFNLIGRPLPDRLNVVMTHNTSSESSEENLVFSSEQPKKILSELEKNGRREVAVIGGREIFTIFLKEKLIDEMYITYEPILLNGIDMFERMDEDVKMKISDVKKLASGAIVIHYVVI